MTNYAKHVSSKVTPQSEAIPGSGQVANSAGGFSFEISPFQKLDRFLILGNEGGSYYADEKAMTKTNAKNVLELIKTDGVKVVQKVVEISDAGRAPKNDPALFVLALAAKYGNLDTRRAAYNALQKVARIGTHLFTFADNIEEFGGWGRGAKNAVKNWYLEKETDQLAYQVVKYQQRNGRSHRDMLRLAHLYVPEADSEKAGLIEFIRTGNTEKPTPRIVQGASLIQVEDLKVDNAIRLIKEYKLPREAIPTQFLTDANVWDTLLEGMPMTAMIRNLATMTRVGLLSGNSDATQRVISELSNAEKLKKARIHPIQLLIAQKTYEAGHGLRGSNTWNPVSQIIDALNDAFYASFDFVTPSNKRHLLALDVSGSMQSGEVAGVPNFSPRDASAAMALVTAKTEPRYEIVGFTGGGRGYYAGRTSNPDELTKLSISSKQRLTDAVRTVSGLPFGGTDCALPMIYASNHKLEIDAFVIYTDSETWAGSIHPVQALKKYRQETGIPAKLIVVGMVSNNFSIADPKDAGMLDVVGFDTSAPTVIGDFVRGEL
jgi:60 kDa SS-A/Ro ribonucleoprotein